MAWVAVAIGGSALIGAGSSYLSAQSANRNSERQANATRDAASQQRNFDTNNALDVMVRQMRAMYGQQQGDAMLRQYLPQEQIDQLFGSDQGQYAGINDRISSIDSRVAEINAALRQTGANALSVADRRAITAERTRLNGERSVMNQRLSQQTEGAWQGSPQATSPNASGAMPFPNAAGSSGGSGGSGGSGAGSGGFMGQMNDLIGQFDSESRGILTDYNADTGRINDLGEQNVNDLYGWGDARNAQITRDTGRMQNVSNAAINAQMSRSGLGGSSLAAQALSGNARRLFEGASDQRSQVADQQRALTASARNDNINRLMSRSGGRTALQGNIVNSSQQLRQQPLQAQMNMLTGSAFSPFANRSSASYFPGVTGNNNATTGLGAAMSGQLYGGSMQALLSQLYGNGGGSQYGGAAGSSAAFGANGSNTGNIINAQNWGGNMGIT